MPQVLFSPLGEAKLEVRAGIEFIQGEPDLVESAEVREDVPRWSCIVTTYQAAYKEDYCLRHFRIEESPGKTDVPF